MRGFNIHPHPSTIHYPMSIIISRNTAATMLNNARRNWWYKSSEVKIIHKFNYFPTNRRIYCNMVFLEVVNAIFVAVFSTVDDSFQMRFSTVHSNEDFNFKLSSCFSPPQQLSLVFVETLNRLSGEMGKLSAIRVEMAQTRRKSRGKEANIRPHSRRSDNYS